ncbi:MAG: hypothetical protein ACRCWI_01895 [Brevinema sp.]
MIKHLIIFLLCYTVPNYGKSISWSINNLPSLRLTDQTGVVESNNAIMVDPNATINRIRIEDIVLEEEYSFTNIFVTFQKQNFSSYVRVKIYDTFTDTEVFSFDFVEQDIYRLTNDQIALNRVYLVLELYGEDIELRSAGMGMVKRGIIQAEDLILNTTTLRVSQENLEITASLKESAKVSLLIYNRNGDICKSLILNKVLNRGTYTFYMDLQELLFDYLEDKRYYVWLRAENLRSSPVELIKSFYIIP